VKTVSVCACERASDVRYHYACVCACMRYALAHLPMARGHPFVRSVARLLSAVVERYDEHAREQEEGAGGCISQGTKDLYKISWGGGERIEFARHGIYGRVKARARSEFTKRFEAGEEGRASLRRDMP